MITVLSCPYREILLDLSIVSKIRQWHGHLNRQLREVSFMKVQWWGMGKKEALCLVSHPWLPWVNPAIIHKILKNSVENAGSEIRKHRITEMHRFSNTPRESSTSLTHCIAYRVTVLLQSPSHLWCHPAEGKLPDCLAPQSPCSGHCQIHSLPLSA